MNVTERKQEFPTEWQWYERSCTRQSNSFSKRVSTVGEERYFLENLERTWQRYYAINQQILRLNPILKVTDRYREENVTLRQFLFRKLTSFVSYAGSVSRSREATCFSIFRETDPLRSFAVGITTRVYPVFPVFLRIHFLFKRGKRVKKRKRNKKDRFNSWRNLAASPIVIARTSCRYISPFKTGNIFSRQCRICFYHLLEKKKKGRILSRKGDDR